MFALCGALYGVGLESDAFRLCHLFKPVVYGRPLG